MCDTADRTDRAVLETAIRRLLTPISIGATVRLRGPEAGPIWAILSTNACAMVGAVARDHTATDRDDIAQEALFRLVRRERHLFLKVRDKNAEDVAKYLLVCLWNAVTWATLDSGRRRATNAKKRTGSTALESFADPREGSDPEAALVARELAERIKEIIAKLPARQREAFLTYLDCKDCSQAAVQLGTDACTVRAYVHRARRRIKIALQEYSN